MKMVELVISGEPDMSVSSIESQVTQRPTYSITIMEELEKRENFHPALLIGGDSLLNLHTWYRAEELVENYTILTYPRKDSPVSEAELSCHWDKKTVEKLISGMIPGKFFEISSTEIRKSMEKSRIAGNIKNMTKTFPEVGRYIEIHRLYGNHQTKDK